jgi:ankyrin repeat protein
VVRTLLKTSVDLEVADEYGATALIMAAYRGHTAVVKELLDAGASINAADKNGWTAMVWAVSRRHNDVVELLKQYQKK